MPLKLLTAVLKNSHKQGFILLEVIIAIVIIAISLLSFFYILSPTLSLTTSRSLFLDSVVATTSSLLKVDQKCSTLTSFGFECSYVRVDTQPKVLNGPQDHEIDLRSPLVSPSSQWYLVKLEDPQTQQTFFMVVYEP